MKLPAGVVATPIFNPALGDVRNLVSPGRAARFCQICLQPKGSQLARFTRQNELSPPFVAKVCAEKEAKRWPDAPWLRYWQQIEHTLTKLGYAAAIVWVSEGKRVEWVVRVAPSKVRQFHKVEEAHDAALTAKIG